jgi:ribosome-associated translation inhibitor RaiA
MNRITVVSEDDAINAQARTYAEYRVFAALARHTRNVRRVRVVLRQVGAGEACDTIACAITVTLEPSGVLKIRATGPHAYAAINRAVERLGQALGRRVEQRLSS